MKEDKKEEKKQSQSERIEALRKSLNKKKGSLTTAHNLKAFNPSDVKQWISTGSRWLDSIIASKENLIGNNAKIGGIPLGKVVECAGLESTGKSYLAMQIATNAQKMGIDVVYFDSEAALDSTFCERMGADLESIIYLPAGSVENVADSIEELLKTNSNPMLFIWDSLANTPTNRELEGEWDPQKLMAIKARVLSIVMAKLIGPINSHGSTLLVINQLKTNIDPSNPMIHLTEPYVTSGGKAMLFAYSLRIWLTGRKAKKWHVEDAVGDKIGTDVKVQIKKSRFGSEGRECNFKILWSGPKISIQDEESWLDAIKGSKYLKTSGAWYALIYSDGEEEKFQGAHWLDKLKEEKFRNRVLEIMDELLIK